MKESNSAGAPATRITVVVIEDHPLFRQGVVNTLSLEPDMRVLGQAANGATGLDLIRSYRPQVAVVDINLTEMNGQQIAHTIIQERLPTRVILLTAYDDVEQKIHAMSAGASAYCTKDIPPEKLVEVVRNVASGDYLIDEERLDPNVIDKWLSDESEKALRSYGDPGEPYSPLSPREMEVLGHLTNGLSNKEIAAQLGISHQTVKNHVTAILRKLSVEDRTQAALYALRRGWVRLYH
jgi:DNA-binding NarL/FixJ family response regulator